MATYLFKTEPSEYAWADLVRDRRAVWEGVANALALKHLRAVQKGDEVVVYHTGSEKAAVGLAKVVRGPYPDPKLEDERRVVVDLAPVAALPTPVTLATLKADAVWKDSDLVRLARLSVMPLSAAQVKRLRALAGLGA